MTLMKDKKTSADKKIVTLLGAVREFSIRATGSFTLKLGEITSFILPDLELVAEMDVNILLNLGAGSDGDRGSSGMPPGFHVFIKPPPMDFIGDFIQNIFDSLTKVLKVGNFPVPKFPSLSGVEMGFSLGETMGFKFHTPVFSMSCVIKTKNGFGISCKIGLDFLTILKDVGKWIASMGKKLFDAAGKKFMEIADVLGVGNFVKDIAAGAKKVFKGIENAAKAAKKVATKVVASLKDSTKKAVNKIKDVHKKAAKKLKNAKDKAARSIKFAAKLFDGSISKLAKEIKKIISEILKSIFSPGKLKKEKKAKEQKKRDLKKQKNDELNKIAYMLGFGQTDKKVWILVSNRMSLNMG